MVRLKEGAAVVVIMVAASGAAQAGERLEAAAPT